MVFGLNPTSFFSSPNSGSPTITYTNSQCIAHFIPFSDRSLDPTLGNEANIENNDFSIEKSFEVIPPNTLGTTELIEDNAIIHCSIARDKNTPSGYFELTLKPVKNYTNLIKPGDWVLIYLDDSSAIDLKSRRGLRCIGNVNRIAENKVTMENGAVITSYSIHGSDFGKIFEKTEMFFDAYELKDLASAALREIALNLSGSPIDYFNGYLDIFLGDAKKQGLEEVLFQVLIPPRLYSILEGEERSKGGDVSFNDLLIRDFKEEAGEGYSSWRSISRSMAGSLWTTLEQAANREFNEVYTDVINGKPTIILQKQPLTKDLLMKRINESAMNKDFEISESVIVNSNIGAADHALCNHISLFPSDEGIRDQLFALAGSDSIKQDFPQVDKELIKRFGLRRGEFNSEYLWTKDFGIDIELATKWIRELGEYWFNFHRFENGTLEIMGKNNFQIGKFYSIPERRKSYLVESIQWDWNYLESIVVTLGVTHGVFSNGAFTDSDSSDKVDFGTTVYLNSNSRPGVGGLIDGIKKII